ncbi:phage holin family protein [Lapillicoccus sp.]|uniref:phage holin family protein n=1 Tax=Lapillicoccus sp. TaxID=1909287 RepID=UPI0025F84B2A|nr:phage holin family protein [Lapillicoccus sp.]
MGLLSRIAVKTAVNGAALWVAGLVVSGISFNRSTEWTGTVVTIVLVALVFGLVNAVIKPVVKLFSLPLIWLTLGLFTLVVNALMLELTSWLAGNLGLGFHVDSFFWSAVLGAVVVTIVSMVLNIVVPDRKD